MKTSKTLTLAQRAYVRKMLWGFNPPAHPWYAILLLVAVLATPILVLPADAVALPPLAHTALQVVAAVCAAAAGILFLFDLLFSIAEVFVAAVLVVRWSNTKD